MENWFEGLRVQALESYGVTATPIPVLPTPVPTSVPTYTPVPTPTQTIDVSVVYTAVPIADVATEIITLSPTPSPTPVYLPNNSISFRASSITGGNINVYTGPSSSSYRALSVNHIKVFLSTNETVWYAGYDGNWLLVMYEKSSDDGVRVGYISKKSFQNGPTREDLHFANLKVFITKSTFMTDDPRDETTSLKYFNPGDSVLFLAKYKEYAYVETTINGLQARGFIPLSSLR